MGNWPEDYFRKARGPVTFGDKINPLWWIKNTDDPVEDNGWYLPGKPLWYRRIRWGIRNPLANFRRYNIGFWDKQNIWIPERWKRNPIGWDGQDTQWPLDGEGLGITLQFISYRVGAFEGYFGWNGTGEFKGPAFRRR